MNHPFLVADVLVKSTYSVSPRKRYCQNVAVSEEGFVAVVSESDCFVLNPYNHDLYDIPTEETVAMEDDSSKKAIRNGTESPVDGQSRRDSPQWSGSSFLGVL